MQPRYYQVEAEQSIHDYFNAGNKGSPVVALPTGTGKSVVIGSFVANVLRRWPGQRIIAATHVKELIEQNADKLRQIDPWVNLGIFSAGLRQKNATAPVVYGGIASMIKNPALFGWRDIMLIDEAHLVNPAAATNYAEFIKALRTVNPRMPVVGFTATRYRMGMGYITSEDGLFTDVCYDKTDIAGFAELMAGGYLCTLVPRPTSIALDVSDVGHSVSTGDFNLEQLQAAVDQPDLTYRVIAEAVRLGSQQRSWLCFCAGIEHSEHVAEVLRSFGVSTAVVHSKIASADRDKRIADFKAGKIRCLVGANVFTTGFDHPPVDLIIMLRPTKSTPLWVQMLGRGTRPSVGKGFCLVLDFARNTPRLGPINDPVIPKAKGKGGGDAPVKICDRCGTYNHSSARFCVGCGEMFDFTPNIVTKAGTEELIRTAEIKSDAPQIETFDVSAVYYYRHQSEKKPLPSLKAVYVVKGQLRQYVEFVNLEHDGWAGKQAREWWRQRHAEEPPTTIADALMKQSELRPPKRIRVIVNKVPYAEIIGVEF